MTLQEKLDLVTNYFAEDWAIEKAMQLLEDYDKAPQPVERKPLTPEQMDATLGSAKKVKPGYIGWATDQRREWGRAVERAHGIKGGQHGAE